MEAKRIIPRHIAVIMDGNGRWALQRGKERAEGHLAGAQAAYGLVRAAAAEGIEYLTLYVFSTENWGRPQHEVDAIMELFCAQVVALSDELVREGVKVVLVGEREGMSEKVLEHWAAIERLTASCNRITLALAMNYSSRNELSRAAKRLAAKVVSGEMKVEQIDADTIGANLLTANIPDPDLVIRTGGEYRLSNFLLWQSAYAELYFTPTLWPDFDADELHKAIEDYSTRDRRFGRVAQNADNQTA